MRIIKSSGKIFFNIIFKKYISVSQKISSSNFEYDPWLGDKMYPKWYWEKAIDVAGYELCEYLDTNMGTVKGTKAETLKHFICKK